MRLYPPAVAIVRQATDPVGIGATAVPRGALVSVLVYTLHHDPYWFADPEAFRTERFAPAREPELPPRG